MYVYVAVLFPLSSHPIANTHHHHLLLLLQLTPPPERAYAIQAAQRRLEGVLRRNPRFRDGRVHVFGSALSELGTARCVFLCVFFGGSGWVGCVAWGEWN